MREQISILMDGELDDRARDDALNALAQQRDLRAAWGRYHLMRAALRNEYAPLSIDLADRIAAGIAADSSTDIVVALHPRADWRRFSQGLYGLALAASVAAISIVGMRWLLPVNAPQQTQIVAAATPIHVAATPVDDVNVNTAPHRRGIHWDTPQPEVENNLNALLVQHSEFTPTSGMGVMSYVRIAGYDTARE